MRRCLQYAFFMTQTGDIIACDDPSADFWETCDQNEFLSHVNSLLLDSVTSTTVILEKTSFTLRVVPVDSVQKNGEKNERKSIMMGFIVVLHNQMLLSAVFYQLGSLHTDEQELDALFEHDEAGIYITRADGISLFINARYENISGISRKDAVGRSIYQLSDAGMFMPLVTPVILKIRKEYTIFQSFSGNRSAIISGLPIYDATGEVYCILICVNQVKDERLHAFSMRMVSKTNLNSKLQFASYNYDQLDIIAEDESMRKTLQSAIKVAHYDVPILLLGESGTGKEVLGSVIHTSSRRRSEAFVKINCSAITPTLLEAELFGYEAGAFTGASPKGKPGLFEVANKGTILLDEIGDMPLESQAKLLRVIQNGEVYRVGGLAPIHTTARIIAATNRDLKAMIERGQFRADLYYRLSVIPIYLPPLRERRAAIVPLLLHFSHKFNHKYRTNKRFSPALLDMLSQYDWPGNVRELKNLVERMTILFVDELLLPSHYAGLWSWEVPSTNRANRVTVEGIPLLETAVQETERIVLSRALERTQSTRKAAKLVGISQTTFLRKAKKLEIGFSVSSEDYSFDAEAE